MVKEVFFDSNNVTIKGDKFTFVIRNGRLARAMTKGNQGNQVLKTLMRSVAQNHSEELTVFQLLYRLQSSEKPEAVKDTLNSLLSQGAITITTQTGKTWHLKVT